MQIEVNQDNLHVQIIIRADGDVPIDGGPLFDVEHLKAEVKNTKKRKTKDQRGSETDWDVGRGRMRF